MRIVLVAPIDETVPPTAYGGIEQMVHFLDHDLAARGHQVTLLASEGSSSPNRLFFISPRPSQRPLDDEGLISVRALKLQAARRAAEIIIDENPDVVLNHSWRLLDCVRRDALLTTIHFPLDAEPYRSTFLARNHAQYVAISHAQRGGGHGLKFVGTIHNGVDSSALPYCPEPGSYLAFLGRISPVKGLDIAIRVAQRVGIPLKVAAKLDYIDRAWFDDVISPLLNRGGVEFLGEITASDKGAFLGGALALLHPSRWSEPFGLAAVEAMACGTPVLTLRRGAAAEVVQNGVTGFVVDEEDGLVRAVDHLKQIARKACRDWVVSRFDRRIMADKYEQISCEALSRQ